MKGTSDDESGSEQLASLSHGQRALWFVHSLAPESIAYQGSYCWRLQGPVDAERLQAGLLRLAERHPALRTSFAVVDGEPRQRIDPQPSLRLEEVDASAWAPEELTRRLHEDAGVAFDLDRSPLVRFTLYRQSEDRHRLLLAIHHIILDHWSIAGLMHELQELYRDAEAPLPPPEATYLDFVAWQAEMLAGPRGDKQWAHWRSSLGGQLPILDLPLDRPRPPLQTYNGGSLSIDLDHKVVRRLEELARRRGITLFMVLLAAFQTLLHRFTGQDDIIVGTPMAGRGPTRFARVVGYFTNLIPLRADLSADPTFDEFLHQIRDCVLDGMQYQDFPFSLMVERLGLSRDPSRAPLCDVVFAWEGAPPIPPYAEDGSGPRLDMHLEELRQLGAAVDTAWSAFERDGSIAIAIQYNSDLLDRETVAGMAAAFGTLLAAIADDPARRLSRLPIVSADERHRLLEEWNPHREKSSDEATLDQLFAVQADKTPDAPAVICDDRSLSYRELNSRANRLARQLTAMGIGTETRVGLCVERTPEMVIGMLGVLKAGGAFVPLDPTYPTERLAYMLRDAGVAALLTQESLLGTLPEHDAETLILDANEPTTDEDLTNPPAVAAGDGIAYVIYTSGSTGEPKGVMVRHRGLYNTSTQQQRVLGLQAGDRILQFASLSFDACVWELVMALRWGGTLYLGAKEDLLPGPPLARFLERHRIQRVTLPPSALAAMPAVSLPDLHTIMVAGERCAADLARQWAAGRRFLNLYGPTEATIWSTWAELDTETDRVPPIGRPIGNTRAYLLDETLEPVPVGVAGELYLGGAGVARGYLGRPGLTAERFLPDPFTGRGQRMYRTGDRVRYRRDGSIDFLGRTDHQIKLRGYRIELGEVESVLRSHPGVREAVAQVLPDRGRGETLAAWVDGTANAELDEAELRQLLQAKLPDYMVPGRIVILDALPLTPNGKIDVKALPRPGAAGAHGDAGVTAPGEGLQRTLAAIWSQVLEVEPDVVGIDQSFFELGGHSLLLAQVHERLEKALGQELHVSLLFRFPTIRALAAHLEGGSEKTTQAADRARTRKQMAGRLRRGGSDRRRRGH